MIKHIKFADSDWPQGPDGRKKTLGELSPGERGRVVLDAVDGLKAELMRKGIALDLAALPHMGGVQ